MNTCKNVPMIFQQEPIQCGAACLAMVLGYFGKEVTLEQLWAQPRSAQEGCSAGDLVRAAAAYGISCRGFRTEPERLKNMPLPAVLHWNFNHFVVLTGLREELVCLNDPQLGPREISFKELEEAFTGVVLTFEPEA